MTKIHLGCYFHLLQQISETHPDRNLQKLNFLRGGEDFVEALIYKNRDVQDSKMFI